VGGLLAELDAVTWHQDEPFGSTSIYAQWCVFRLAREHGVAVMLDGQGADEALGGYHGYFGPHLAGLLRHGRWPMFWREAAAARLAAAREDALPALVDVLQSDAPEEPSKALARALVRELGPVLAATMLAGRVGSAMAAELGTMRVTEQIDALESMGANPIYYLVVPRFLGCLVLIPTLTIMADFMGVLGGYLYSHLVLGIDYHHYWANSREYVDAFDFLMGIFKTFFFGAAIALVSCHHGFHCDHGAEGVGRAATNAFVHSFVLILVLDLFLGIWLNNVHDFFRPEGPRKLL
jgi:ABC transport permease subunit